MAEWVRASTGDRTLDGSSPTSVNTFLFGTLAIPFTPLCQCLSDETVKSRGSLLSGVYATGMVTVLDFTSHAKPPRSASMRQKKLPCTDKEFSLSSHSLTLTQSSSSSSQLLCRAAFNAAYSHTGGQARELVRS